MNQRSNEDIPVQIFELEILIKRNLISKIEFIPYDDKTSYCVKVFELDKSGMDFHKTRILVTQKKTIKSYTSTDRSIKAMKELGYNGDFIVKQCFYTSSE